jgi:hypothetical protein
MMATCRICHRPGIREWLDFGPQALTNRFLRSPDEREYLHVCKIGACRACGTVQLESPVPVDEMRPRFDWISYNEPERHLDDVADVLAKLPGLTPASALGGMTYKDESTLKRLNARGFPNTWQAHIRDDLGVESPLCGIESVQDRLTQPTAAKLAAKFGRPDLLLVRHVLEHSYDIHEVLRAVRGLVKPGGYALFEMPDCRKSLDRLDYTTVWEEHIFYFTPATLRHCFAASGFEVVFLESYYYSQENVLVAVVKPAAVPEELPSAPLELADELARADRFVREFPRCRHAIQEQVRAVTSTGGKFAMLGAGHLSGAFINLYGLEADTDFVADDNAKKHGLYMPGSKAPILPSSELVTRDIGLCLMSVRAEIEELVVGKNKAFTDRGGVLASVFPESAYSLTKIGRAAGKAA